MLRSLRDSCRCAPLTSRTLAGAWACTLRPGGQARGSCHARADWPPRASEAHRTACSPTLNGRRCGPRGHAHAGLCCRKQGRAWGLRVHHFDVKRARGSSSVRPAPGQFPAATRARPEVPPRCCRMGGSRPSRAGFAQCRRHAARRSPRDPDRRTLRNASQAARLRRRQQRRGRHRHRHRGRTRSEPHPASRRSRGDSLPIVRWKDPPRYYPRRAPTSAARACVARCVRGTPSRPHRGDDPWITLAIAACDCGARAGPHRRSWFAYPLRHARLAPRLLPRRDRRRNR